MLADITALDLLAQTFTMQAAPLHEPELHAYVSMFESLLCVNTFRRIFFDLLSCAGAGWHAGDHFGCILAQDF